ncbi:MAG: amylo-alpha,6-glucosidase [Glaciihabitans sp.]|nr:amylo-alpha,6-glucosidase [Glaciihabitans sp.]
MTDAFRQPLLHDETVVLRAPAQAWSAADGSMGARAIHGLFVSDVRVISELAVEVGGAAGEPIATLPEGASAVSFVSLLRHLDGAGADPRVRLLHRRVVTATGASETLTLQSAVATPIETSVLVRLASDLAGMDAVKAGRAGPGAGIETTTGGATWSGGAVSASLTAPGARLAGGTNLELRWDVTIPAGGEVSVGWSVAATDVHAVVAASTTEPDWILPQLPATDERVGRWVERAVDDLRALRMTTVADPASSFLGAGAPWFFTLFGRDALWAARFLLPLGTETAGGTLRVLAALQGTTSNPNTAEQPGKIMHELRRGTLSIENDIELPPLYYGTVDATALWICLLHDAWRAGLPDAEVRALLPNLTAALAWMRDYGDADGDGLLEYIDESGRGLANQGWKDSGDSVQWKDGRLATGPIALCEVQAYAYEAAMHGADLLEHFGEHGDEWRDWAGALQERFRTSFWIDDPDGAYPAIALDADKRAVDSLTSNIGHLLGTGILDEAESKLVADRLSSPELNSGYGLRTMATSSAGYWPLSYHGGSVWTHDTAIAIAGLTRAGFREQAAPLIEGLLAAASAFDYRMPELHSGDPATAAGRPVPYPAACRPQAWSAAAAISVLASNLAP